MNEKKLNPTNRGKPVLKQLYSALKRVIIEIQITVLNDYGLFGQKQTVIVFDERPTIKLFTLRKKGLSCSFSRYTSRITIIVAVAAHL